jgi:hypothetical protein
VREAVGIRPRRQLARSVHIEILYRLEEQLRRLSADDNEEAAN